MKTSILGSRRRTRLLGAAAVLAAAALALSGCSLSSSGSSGDSADTLTVGIWKDYGADLPWVAKQFKKETGATLKFQYIDSEENLLQLMDKADGGIDVALPNVQYIGKGIDEGLFHELDTKKLTNYDDVYPRFRDLDEIRSDGELYGIPWTWGSTGVFYNTKDHASAPASISALWDGSAKGTVAVTDDATVLVPSAALYLGEDPQNPDMTKVKAALEQLKANTKVTYTSTSDLAKSISSGSVSLGIANSDGIGGMIGGGQSDLAYTVPKEGAVGWIDNWAISAKTKHLALAYKWLNYMTGPEFLTKWANTPADAAPAPANEKVVASLPEETKTRLQADPSSIDKLAIQLPVPADRLQEWTDTWQEVKAG